jgi:hypothetical protein
MQEIDRDEWDREWSSMQHREVPDGVKLTIKTDPQLGKGHFTTIAEAPVQYLDRMYLPTEECAICSISTINTDRLPASANWISDEKPDLKIGYSTWVHRDCFEELKVSNLLPPIPW